MTILPPRRDLVPELGDANTLKPLEGISSLSPATYKALAKTGFVLRDVEVGHLPAAFKIATAREVIDVETPEIDAEESIRVLLPHIARLAYQGVAVNQIAHRLGLKIGHLKEAAIFIEGVAAALQGGAAEGVDNVTAGLVEKAASGEPRAAKLFLEHRAEGWEPRPQQTPINITVGKETALVSLDSIEILQDTQLALLEGIDYGDLG